MKHVLFVCTANVDRSKTAQDFFSEQFGSIEFKSAGIDELQCKLMNSNFLTQELLDWANHVFVMEDRHFDWIHTHLDAEGKHLEVLNIEDTYTYYSIELIEILQQKCTRYFE